MDPRPLGPRQKTGLWYGLLRQWDRLAMYMPLLTMAVLALGTYWLVRNTPAFISAPAAVEVGHEVDYFMHKFTVKTFAYSNGDGSEVQLTGNARVIREATTSANGKENPRLEFQGEFLHAFLNEERVTSHKPVVLIRGNDQFSGDNFSYDNLDQIALLNGRVKGVLMPKPPVRSAP